MLSDLGHETHGIGDFPGLCLQEALPFEADRAFIQVAERLCVELAVKGGT